MAKMTDKNESKAEMKAEKTQKKKMSKSSKAKMIRNRLSNAANRVFNG